MDSPLCFVFPALAPSRGASSRRTAPGPCACPWRWWGRPSTSPPTPMPPARWGEEKKTSGRCVSSFAPFYSRKARFCFVLLLSLFIQEKHVLVVFFFCPFLFKKEHVLVVVFFCSLLFKKKRSCCVLLLSLFVHPDMWVIQVRKPIESGEVL